MRSISAGIFVGVSLFGALGLWALGVGLRNVYRSVASEGWPTVPGIVTESSPEKSATRDGAKSSTTYGARTVVKYRVGDRELETGTRHFGQVEASGDASEAALELLRHPIGKNVRVSHDPRDPSIATVHPGLRSSALLLPLAGIAFLGAAALILSMGGGASGTGMVITVFSLIFCGIGAAMLIPGATNLWYARASRTWPTAQAVIVYGPRPHSEAPPATDAPIGEAPLEADSLEESSASNRLVYRYDAGGERRFGNVRQFGQLSGSSDGEWAPSIASRYPLGQTVTVAYSPTDPELSVLEPGISTEALFLPGAGLAFLLFGLAALRWAVPALSR
jgi:hypothetical protein